MRALFFFFNDTATTEIYTLSLHDALPISAASTSASLAGVAEWFSGKDNRRVLFVSDGFHMLRLRIIANRLGLQPFTSPAPNSPIRSNPRRNAAYFLAEGFKVPVTWVFNR